jgi:hypothetical protein
MAKRSYAVACEEDDVLRIKLADEEGREPLQAQLLLLLPLSQCVRSLPDKTEWDLSNLLIDGQPVTRSTVVSWLNCAYKYILYCDFERQELEQQSAVSLYQLLVFADAVGSQKVLMKACVAAHAETLKFVVKLGEQEVQLDISGLYFFGNSQATNHLILCGRSPSSLVGLKVGTAASMEERSAFMSQLAAQVEQLLFIAYKLQLEQLLGKVNKFLASSMVFGDFNPLLWGLRDTIFSKRVMDAAAVSPEGKSALIHDTVRVMCGFSQQWDLKQLLEPVDLPQDAKQPLKFKAVLKEAAFGLPAGCVVQAELDLFGLSTMTLDGVGQIWVQLCLNPAQNT